MDADQREQWRQADRLFARVLDLAPEQRELALAALDVPAPVAAKLARLLANEKRPCRWLDREHVGLDAAVGIGALGQEEAAGQEGTTALAGRRIGAWRIESELGRGGMAVVYRARRVDGAADQVAALKLLALGGFDREGAERFRRETDILARLNHPNIVTLLDAGIADDGTPWLAMPLVDGLRIDQWCAQNQPDTRQVVELVLQVCAAVAGAHRSLVIHRDIKPSNVLVDVDGQVRLLDFGIARIDKGDREATATRSRALTPDYAAPEQLRGEAPTTAIDIHGLGALAYRLLAGRAPRRPAPEGAVTLPSVAAGRHADWPGGYRQALRGDLDRVLMKALADQPDQRYGTVEALADDLRRWLGGHPVRATGSGRWYRLRRFIGRHRVGAAASVALVALLVAGIAATLWQAQRAQREAERAVAVRDLLVDVLKAADPTVASTPDPPASELLRRGAIQMRERLAGRPDLLAELLQAIGHSQINRAQLEDARQSLDDALQLHRSGAVDDPQQLARLLFMRSQLAYELGQPSTGIDLAREGERIAAGLGDRDLHERLQVRLADLLMFTRQTDQAVELARSLVERIQAEDRQPRPDQYYRALLVLGTAAEIDGDQEQAIRWLEQAAEGFAGRPDSARTLANIENTLGVAHLNAGRLEQAESRLRSALAVQTGMLGADHPDALVTRGNLSGVLMYSGQTTAAVAALEGILADQRKLTGEQPHPDVAVLLGYLARARYLGGDSAGALAAAELAHAELSQVAAGDRGGLDWIDPLTGLLRLERQQADPDGLLDSPAFVCDPAGGGSTGRWICLARALAAADRGECRAPSYAPDDHQVPPGLVGIDRRWWAVYWLLQRQCGEPARVAQAGPALAELVGTAQPPFPAWLQERIAAAAPTP